MHERQSGGFIGFMDEDANAILIKVFLQMMVDSDKYLKDIQVRILVDRLVRTDKGCII